jgi:haloacetate dehalogenase
MDDYIRCFRAPRAIAAVWADFRASPGPGLAHDEESIAAGQKVECPVLVLWGQRVRPAPVTIRRLSDSSTRPTSAA